jgi:hypothetical protein
MSAIITETFRKNNAKAFLADIADVANRYYVGLGKSDSWPASDGSVEDDADYEVASPLGTYADVTETLNNLTTLIGITGNTYSQVIPNIAVKSSRRHKAYNPYDPDCFYQTLVDGVQMYPCYAIASDNVYLCLKESTAVLSTDIDLPTGSNTSRVPFQPGNDGSVWIYLYTIRAEFPINVTQFVSVPTEPTLNGVETEATIESGSGDLVYGFTIINPGDSPGSPPSAIAFVSEAGVVTPLAFTVDGSNNITSVSYPGALSPLTWIKDRGYVRITGGSAISRVYPNIAPHAGFGAVPANDLPSWYAGIAIEAIETINDDGAFIPYRQVSIVKNPSYEVGVIDPTLSLNCLQRLNFGVSDAPTSATTGSIITQTATGAKGIADYYDPVNKYMYYHQTFETGFIPFNSSVINFESSTYIPISIATSEHIKQTGEVVFTENRKKITRIGGQTEEITIILQF